MTVVFMDRLKECNNRNG